MSSPPASAPPPPASDHEPAHRERAHHHDGPLAHSKAAAEASQAFDKLHQAVESVAPRGTPAVSSGGPTLEDITRDLLRPMIAAWLDENLADIVRSRVDEEIERIARGRVR